MEDTEREKSSVCVYIHRSAFEIEINCFLFHTFSILCLSFSFSFKTTATVVSSLLLSLLVVYPLSYPIKMITLLRLINLSNVNNLQKDTCNPYSFARGFDDFVVTWPPSTNSTSMNDEK
jgi:hypothetical protein